MSSDVTPATGKPIIKSDVADGRVLSYDANGVRVSWWNGEQSYTWAQVEEYGFTFYPDPNRWVLVERTLTVRFPVQMSAYPGLTEAEVLEYEKSRDMSAHAEIMWMEAGDAFDSYENGAEAKLSVTFHDESPLKPKQV